MPNILNKPRSLVSPALEPNEPDAPRDRRVPSAGCDMQSAIGRLRRIHLPKQIHHQRQERNRYLSTLWRRRQRRQCGIKLGDISRLQVAAAFLTPRQNDNSKPSGASDSTHQPAAFGANLTRRRIRSVALQQLRGTARDLKSGHAWRPAAPQSHSPGSEPSEVQFLSWSYVDHSVLPRVVEPRPSVRVDAD